MNKLYPNDYCCIVTKYESWYCNYCGKNHKRLYVNNLDKSSYCDNCVPEDIKNKSVDINQNREIIGGTNNA